MNAEFDTTLIDSGVPPKPPKKKALPVSVERQAWHQEREALQAKVTAALAAGRDRLWRWVPAAAVAGAVVGFALGRLA